MPARGLGRLEVVVLLSFLQFTAWSQAIGPAINGNGGLSSLMGAGSDQEGMLRALSRGPNGRAGSDSKPELRHPVALLSIDGGARFLVSSFMSDQVLVGRVPSTASSRTMAGNHPDLHMEVFAAGVYCLQTADSIKNRPPVRHQRRHAVPVTRRHEVGSNSAPRSKRRERGTLKQSVVVRSSAALSPPMFWQASVGSNGEASSHRHTAGCAVLNSPWGLAMWDGAILVASFGSDQVLLFDQTSGTFLGHLGDSTSLDSPEGLAVGLARIPVTESASNKYHLRERPVLFVANFVSGSISRFDLETGRFIGFLVSATPPRPLAGPEGLVFIQHGTLRGTLLVVSHWSNSIEAFDGSTGEHLGTVMQGPSREGEDADEAATVIMGIQAANAGHTKEQPIAAEIDAAAASDVVTNAANATLGNATLLDAAWNASLHALETDQARATVEHLSLLRGPVGISVSHAEGNAVHVIVTAYQTGKLLEARIVTSGAGTRKSVRSSAVWRAWGGTMKGVSAVAMMVNGGTTSPVLAASYDSHTLTVLNTSAIEVHPVSSKSAW